MSDATHSSGPAETAPPAILLAIRPAFADRIFAGTKKYELRKRLPTRPFGRVYLYVVGGGGVVGCFDAASVITDDPAGLWAHVGEDATSQARFFRYFEEWEQGSAIEVSDPVRFTKAVLPEQLRQIEGSFNAPQSFLYLEPGSPMHRILERKRTEAKAEEDISLRPIHASEYELFERLVTESIKPRYDEITEQFAKNLIRVHEARVDEHGILTQRKEVLAIVRQGSELLGFTTLTYKMGHSVKTGPTVLLRSHRGKGIGQKTRPRIEAYARASGCRKIYCTCPDDDAFLIRHFVRCNYRIEGHLLAHYQAHRGELVFGKVLAHATEPTPLLHRDSSAPARVEALEDVPKRLAERRLRQLFEFTWFDPTAAFAKHVVEASLRGNGKSYEEKPVDLLCLMSGVDCVGMGMLVPKRGGAVKMLLLSSTSHSPSISRLLAAAMRKVKIHGRRKLYLVHPINDPMMHGLLVQEGFQIEAALQEPYRVGQDALVMSKFS